MANLDHLKILREGPEAWNRWMATNYSTVADLSFADLSKINMSLCDFQEVDLRDANLEGADLSFSKFIWTDLSGANLYRTNLRSATFGEAILKDADLRYADLSFTVFNDSNLRKADLEGAICQQTYFTGIDLSTTLGLDKCDHWTSSNVDLRTLIDSRELPIEFIHGCGISRFLIEHLNDIKDDPRQFYSCFISYSQKDYDFARKIYSDLVQEGVRCWFAPENMRFGRKVRGQIDQALSEYDKLLLVLSEDSMKSTWVEYEILRVRRRELQDNLRLLFPISLVPFEELRGWELFCSDEGRDLAREIREYFIPDFSSWNMDQKSYSQSFERLLFELKL